jgi:hypothetical protein
VEKAVHEALGNDHGLHLAFCIKHDNIMVRVSKRRRDQGGDLPPPSRPCAAPLRPAAAGGLPLRAAYPGGSSGSAA